MASANVKPEIISVKTFDSGLILFGKNNSTKPAIKGRRTVIGKILSQILSNL